MMIRNMFAEDINRQINGVIKVDQDTTDVIEQEVREYVITKELKKHFINFFDFYSDSFDKPTDDIGVWISGFFGSGKSHFLKMLSYILENKSVGGVPTVEMFRKKFVDARSVAPRESSCCLWFHRKPAWHRPCQVPACEEGWRQDRYG